MGKPLQKGIPRASHSTTPCNYEHSIFGPLKAEAKDLSRYNSALARRRNKVYLYFLTFLGTFDASSGAEARSWLSVTARTQAAQGFSTSVKTQLSPSKLQNHPISTVRGQGICKNGTSPASTATHSTDFTCAARMLWIAVGCSQDRIWRGKLDTSCSSSSTRMSGMHCS